MKRKTSKTENVVDLDITLFIIVIIIIIITIIVIVNPNSGCVFDVAGFCICMKTTLKKPNSGTDNIDRMSPRLMAMVMKIMVMIGMMRIMTFASN